MVIAHGFAGSRQLMQSFALSFARNGYIAVTFDFAGHGRNTRSMNGDLELIEGATKRLMGDLGKVVAAARSAGRWQAGRAWPFDGLRHRGALCTN